MTEAAAFIAGERELNDWSAWNGSRFDAKHWLHEDPTLELFRSALGFEAGRGSQEAADTWLEPIGWHRRMEVQTFEVEPSKHMVWAIPAETAEQRFTRLADEWREQSRYMSSASRMVMLPAYQKIIGMGWSAVPFMLRELERQPEHWFWALKAITDVDPVPLDEAGRVHAMAEAWIRWGRERGIV